MKPGQRAMDGIRSGEVYYERPALATCASDFLRELVQPRLIARQGNDAVVPGELERDGATDAARRTGDEGGRTFRGQLAILRMTS
jgi:hypothetical protein